MILGVNTSLSLLLYFIYMKKCCMFRNFAVLGVITFPQLTNPTMFAQTLSIKPQCTDVEINKYIQQLNKGEIADFNALVACNSKAIPALIKTLGNQDEEFRLLTIAALGEIGAKSAPALPVLNGLLKDEAENVRIVVVYALGQIMGKEGIRTLIQVLKDKNQDVRSSAANALAKLGKNAVPLLIIALTDLDSNIRSGVADALGQIGIDAKDAIPYLTTALKDSDNTVRSAATNALEKIKKAMDAQQQIEENYQRQCIRRNQENARPCKSKKRRYYHTSNVRQTTLVYLKQNPPVICKIPIIKSVLAWKCS
ncbi:HEAT repeat domain-containing protein [Nostoc sp. CALU 1950]|uniref:HEAT repeat domain-containing protein n=1 Tax=Nostoc sp. CALU 1950 TaxID=3104321 RepID=UPI003EC0C0DF